jgi:hypothetical protein
MLRPKALEKSLRAFLILIGGINYGREEKGYIQWNTAIRSAYIRQLLRSYKKLGKASRRV